MGTQGPKKPNWLVLGAFGGSGEALSWGKKAKLPIGQLKRLSCPMGNLAHITRMENALGFVCVCFFSPPLALKWNLVKGVSGTF